ncbi:MAG: hypothetical protein C5B47_05900 [Verrucomicrobia bacterium]|nr:MAG: hypothetical protein C5B47_05900 [Verrucomicrobiota bacterium]
MSKIIYRTVNQEKNSNFYEIGNFQEQLYPEERNRVESGLEAGNPISIQRCVPIQSGWPDLAVRPVGSLRTSELPQ